MPPRARAATGGLRPPLAGLSRENTEMGEPMADPVPNVPAPAARRRRLALFLAAAVIGRGVVGWLGWRGTAAAPPEVDLAGAEPAVARAVEAARAEVLRAPRSAAAWGRLGMVLRAHDYGAEANECFAQAERLDAADPHWPY